MSSKHETLEWVLQQLGPSERVTWRAMMGEYVLYYDGKVVGGIYDDRLLVKNTPSSRSLVAETDLQVPYDGAKPMLSLSDVIFNASPGNSALVLRVFEAVFKDLKR